MTSRINIPVHNRFLLDDEDGSIVTTGSLQFYEAGTTTPVAVYSDPDLTVSLGSYIDTDAAGLLPDFHVPTDTAIKIRAYDAPGGESGGGAALWTEDNVWPISSNIDARIAALESSVTTLDSGYRNVVINGGMQVQLGTDATISGTYQEGKVTGVEAKSANATAGTITGQTDLEAASGYTFAVNDLTTPNASDTLENRITVKSQDAARFVDDEGTFSALVWQNTGNAVDYTITISKADAQDDFSSTTQIVTSASATAVASGTYTRIELSAADMGDCSNGIEIVVQADTGAVTTKDFLLSEAQLEQGGTRTAYEQRNFQIDRAALDALLASNNLSDVDDAATARDNLGYPPEFISGLRISSAADADHDITVATGVARDATDAANINLDSALTKQIDAAWAEGNNAGGLPSGVTLSGPEWLYFFVIAKADGTVDAGFDASSTAANLLSDASDYTYYRYAGLVKTGASDNVDIVLPIGESWTEVLTSGTSWQSPPEINRVWRKIVAPGGGGGGGTGNSSGSTTLGDDGTSGGTTSFDGVSATGGGGGRGGGKPGNAAAVPGSLCANNGGTGGQGADVGYGPGTAASGGEIIEGYIQVTPGATITYSIGSAGTGGTGGTGGGGFDAGGDGADGEDGTILLEYTL